MKPQCVKEFTTKPDRNQSNLHCVLNEVTSTKAKEGNSSQDASNGVKSKLVNLGIQL